jgi:ATPase subunit of ABC transporter with duplicated ATPase domains
MEGVVFDDKCVCLSSFRIVLTCACVCCLPHTFTLLCCSNVDLGVDLDSRVAIVGANGTGKSTLLKLMTGQLEPLDGMVKRHNHLRIGVYHQHLVSRSSCVVPWLAANTDGHAAVGWTTQLATNQDGYAVDG